MFIKINELNIHYEVSGSGKAVLLLHGWGCNTTTYSVLANYFEQHFKIYRLDFPGFGKSDLPLQPWTNDDYVALTKNFINQLQLDTPIVFGHSFGGRVALKLVNQTPFHKLILTGSAGIKPQRSTGYYVKIYSYKLLKQLAKIPIISLVAKPLQEAYIKQVGSEDYKKAPEVMRKTLSNVVNTDLKTEMPKIKIPTLLLWGENDTATPVANAKIMEKLIPDSGLVVLKNSGHYVFLEQHQQFIIIMDKFLEKDKK